jgi:hypothetical protein
MTETTIHINGQSVHISGNYYPHCGDGFNDEYEPAHWQINEDLEQLAKQFNMTESELYNICVIALNKQDQSDWELCNTFI